MKLGHFITNEAMLATELLQEKTIQAEAGTPQQYDSFVKDTEAKAVEAKEEAETDTGFDDTSSEGNGDATQETPPDEEVNPDEDTPSDDAQQEADDSNDDPFADSIADETVATSESLSEWITDRTKDSNSGVIRNLGAMVAGLAHIGITYGPATLNYMFKGMLWVFSRFGSLLFSTGKSLNAYIESSKNSIDKLESRLASAESILSENLNNGSVMPKFEFKNQKVIDFITVGSNTDVNGNLRVFSESLVTSTKAIASEFEKGLNLIDKMSNHASPRINGLKHWMEVDVPRAGFVKGSLPGFDVKSDSVEAFHTEPLWPGDASLIFLRPIIKSDDMDSIGKAYAGADLYLGIRKTDDSPVSSMNGLTGPQALIYSKSIRILLSAMKETHKVQIKMHSQGPTFAAKAKKLFIRLADDKAKATLKDSLVEPMFLRASLSQTVFVNGSKASLTHASRVAAAAIAYLEAHATKIATSTE